MTRLFRWTFLPLIAASAAWSSAQAAEVRDHAGMFSPKAVQAAQEELTRVERRTHVPIVIETIDAIPGLAADASHDEKMRAVNSLAEKRDRDIKADGVYILLSKKDKVLSNLLVRERYADVLTREKRRAVGNAFLTQFKAGDFDGGLAKATETLVSALPDGPVAAGGRRRGADAGPGVPARAQRAPQHGLGSLLTIGLGVLAVLFVVRLLGGLLGGRGAGGGYPNQMGGMKGPGMGPGFGGPGYGGGGYGGRGGGFFSSLMGGIGGAMAGNWLYNQFSGQSHGHSHASNYNSTDGSGNDAGGDAIVGGDDGGGGSWGDSGGGGGDWGGGGGDWGGGGGDWGGGDGGGW